MASSITPSSATVAQQLQGTLNNGDENKMGSAFATTRLGSVLRKAVKQTMLRAVPVLSNPYDLATHYAVVLPDNAKAASIVVADSFAGSAGVGVVTDKGRYVTPTTGTCSVTPSGNILFVAGDAPTDVTVDYMAYETEAVEYGPTSNPADESNNSLPVVSGVVALPEAGVAGTNTVGVRLLMEAEIIAGTSGTGKLVILAPSNSAPASGFANLNLAHSQILFHVADAPTSVRVKYGVIPPNPVSLAIVGPAI